MEWLKQGNISQTYKLTQWRRSISVPTDCIIQDH